MLPPPSFPGTLARQCTDGANQNKSDTALTDDDKATLAAAQGKKSPPIALHTRVAGIPRARKIVIIIGALVTVASHDTSRALGASEVAAQALLEPAYPSFDHAGEMAAQELANHTHASIGRITDAERLLEAVKRAVRIFKLEPNLYQLATQGQTGSADRPKAKPAARTVIDAPPRCRSFEGSRCCRTA